MTDRSFDSLLRRMAKSQIADQRDLRGCTPEEIARLETRYGVRLPHSYRQFLAAMGHGAGRLFAHDHMRAQYPVVLELTSEVMTRRLDPETSKSTGDMLPPPGFRLPDGCILIGERLDETWLLIECGARDDSPVFVLSENDWVIQQTHATLLEWLACWCAMAEDAIADGYFRK